MNIEWNKVTWYSKLGALGVIVVVIVLGFYFWSEYQDIQTLNNSLPPIQATQDSKISSTEKEPTNSGLEDWRLYTYSSLESEILPTITFEYPPLLGNTPTISSRKTNPPESISDNWGGFVQFTQTGALGDGVRLEFYRNNNSEDSFTDYVQNQASTTWDSIKYFQVNDLNAARMRFSSSSHYDADVAWYFIELPDKEILAISTSGDKGLLYDDDTDGNSTRDKIISTFQFIEPIDTFDWQTYRNEELGFEMMYSPDKVRPSTPSGNVSFLRIDGGGGGPENKYYGFMSIGAKNYPAETLDNSDLEELTSGFWRVDVVLGPGEPFVDQGDRDLTLAQATTVGNDIPAYVVHSYPMAGGRCTYNVASEEGILFINRSNAGLRPDECGNDPLFNEMISTLRVIDTSEPLINIISPNGSETWEIGKSYKLEWEISNVPDPENWVYSVFLTEGPAEELGSVVLNKPLTENLGILTWIVPQNFLAGKYRVRVEIVDTKDKHGRLYYDDLSNEQFEIVVFEAAP